MFPKNKINKTALTLLTLFGLCAVSTAWLEEVNTTLNNDDENSNVTDILENISTEIAFNKPNDNEKKPWWFDEALKDIAYYLRAHKFNEFDRRYETKPEKAKREYYKYFPRPPLRSLHWEVHRYCESSFMDCVDYLRKIIKQTNLRRTDDTAIVIQEQNWNSTQNAEQIKQVDEECRKLQTIDNTRADPFAGPLERYQWRVTASYYMCWYTMNEITELEHLSEYCDNFSDCLDNNLGPNNKDHRANDTRAYSCALYSFCPDPCCPNRHLSRLENCWDSQDNPCFQNNPTGQRKCALNRTRNTEFRDIVLNRWNVTCECPKTGYEWNSLYGMCIDVDECASNSHNCDPKLEACVNLPGSFRCACKWGHAWNSKTNHCTPSPALALIKLQRHRNNRNENDRKAQSIVKRIFNYFYASKGTKERVSPNLIFQIICSEIFLLLLIR